MLALRVSGKRFVDSEGRTVFLRGINLSGDSKLPKTPDVPSHVLQEFWSSENLSFVRRPFDLDVADEHLARLSAWGYNIVRFIVTWEAIEHAGP